MKAMLNKSHIIVLLATVLVAIIGIIALRPIANRLRDNAEVNQVYSAFTKLTGEIQSYKSSSQQKTIGLSGVQNLLKETPSLQNLHHPQTGQPYTVKLADAKNFITAPSGMKFLDYAGFDGTSFYFGSGSCSDPSQKQQSFIAYSINMKRTSEVRGSCREI